MADVMMTVMFASKIVVKARLKPACTAKRKIFPDAISSLKRSKIKIFASTAIPIDRMTPAILGKVNVACNAERMPSKIST